MSSGNAASGQPEILGSITPRLLTPPLVTGPPGPCPCGTCALTPATSRGFNVVDFARDVCGTPFDSWEELAAIHAGELLPDGRPRFRVVLILAARQNGKTLLGRTSVLHWLAVEDQAQVLITSTDRSYAKRTWVDVHEQMRDNPMLRKVLGPKPLRLTIGEEELRTKHGARVTFAANNRRAGRSLTLRRWLCDELREHRSWDAWSAASNAMNAVPDAQIIVLTNQCDDSGVVLDSLRDSALAFIETGEGDPRLGLIEWSAPPGADPTDPQALAMANPQYGRRMDRDALLGAAHRAKRAGGIELAEFRTEVLCQRVHRMDSAIDPQAWEAAGRSNAVDLAGHRDRVALCLDVALDMSHASLVAAAMIDGRVHLDVVAAWDGAGCTAQLRRELPGIVARVKPRSVGWFPTGPAAAISADMTERRRAGWPPRRVELVEIRAETTAVCMGLAEMAAAGQVRHPKDPMLDQHVAAAGRIWRGDAWVYGRRGAGPIDGAYAAAGAAHLARTLPPPRSTLVAL